MLIISLTIFAYIAPTTPHGNNHTNTKVNRNFVTAVIIEIIANPLKSCLAVKRCNVVYENIEIGISTSDSLKAVKVAFEKNEKGYCIKRNPIKIAKIEPTPPNT
jgi:hypothetical protein